MKPTTARFLEVLQELHSIGVDYEDDVITRSKLSHLRTGRTEVSIDLVVNLCNKFNIVNPAYIIRGTGPSLYPDYSGSDAENYIVSNFTLQEISMKAFTLNKLLDEFTYKISSIIKTIDENK